MRRALLRFAGRGSGSESEATKLRKLLRQWSDAYYNTGHPLATDEQFDAAQRRLAALEEDGGVAAGEEAEVGAPPPRGAARVRHRKPMLSLMSTRRLEELAAFREATERAVEREGLRWVTEIKYDGMALALHYDKEGRLASAVTRGDGEEGEALSLNKLQPMMPQLPRRIDTSVLGEACEVRGEVVLDRRQFDQLRELHGYRTARNAVAGLLRNEAPAGAQLSFVAYDVLSGKCASADYWVRAGLLRQLGFATCPHMRVHERWDCDVEGEVRSWMSEERRKRELSFDADGMVVKLDSRQQCDSLGSTRHHPRHSMAFKWTARQLARTTLLDVEWAVDQSGHLRPVAVVQPVQSEDGSTMCRASLHNWAFVQRHSLRPSVAVHMERSGGTVPHLVPIPTEQQEGGGGERAVPPSHCPCARKAPVVQDGPMHLKCSLDAACPERVAYRAFAMGSVLQIAGLGLVSASQMAHAGLLSPDDPWAVLRLSAADLEALGAGWGEKKAAKLAAAIADSVRQASFETALATLGLPGIGPSAWGDVASAYPSLELLAAASPEELVTVPGVGLQSAQLICGAVNKRNLADLKHAFGSVGLPVAKKSEDDGLRGSRSTAGPLPLRGLRVCVTGVLSVPRSQLAEEVRRAGGSVMAAVSGRTAVVVAGSEATQAKLDKAIRLSVPIETEAQFRRRFG